MDFSVYIRQEPLIFGHPYFLTSPNLETKNDRVFFYLSERRRKEKIKGEQCNLKVVLVYLAAILHDLIKSHLSR